MFDVVIPTYNNLDELKICLSAFEKQTYRDFRVFVCVDGSTDSTMEYLLKAKYNFKFKILTHSDGKRNGRNATRNLAINYLKSKYIMMVDSDIIPASNLLEKHIVLLESKDCISVGNVIYTDVKKNILSDYIQKRGKNKFKDRTEMSSYYLTTGNCAFHSKYFIQSGGQDARMVTYGGGDIEFGYYLWKYFKLSIIYNKEAVGYSKMNKDLNTLQKQMKEFGAINLHYIRKKHPDLKDIFRFDLIESSSFKSRMIRFFLKDSIGRLSQSMISIVPRFLGRMIIHYLIFLSIYRGYISGLRNAGKDE